MSNVRVWIGHFYNKLIEEIFALEHVIFSYNVYEVLRTISVWKLLKL